MLGPYGRTCQGIVAVKHPLAGCFKYCEVVLQTEGNPAVGIPSLVPLSWHRAEHFHTDVL